AYQAPRDLHSFPTRRSSDLKYLMRMILTNTALTVGGSSVLVAFCVGFGPSLLITVFGPEWARFHELFGVLAVGAGASLLRSCLGDRKSTRLNSSHVSIPYAV